MAAVTIDAGAQNSYYSAGNLGWSARSIFAYRTAIQQLATNTTAQWGSAASNEAVAQSFTTVGAIDVNEIRVAIGEQAGTPTDNISLEIYSDTGANLPNASIATAANVYNGAAIPASPAVSWLTFQFTPVSLSATTKYWIVIQRSGAVDGSNNYLYAVNTGSVYAGGGRSVRNTGTWGAESGTNDLAFQILTETPSALYAVTQSTTPELHVWKSTDSGASWSEQDAANNPSVTDANYPFDACDTRSGPYIGTARFTATNTVRAALFNMSTDLWGTDLGAADVGTTFGNERSIRIVLDNAFVTGTCGSQVIAGSLSTDDADLIYRRRATGGWSVATSIFAGNSTEASLIADVVVDKAPIGFQHQMYYEVVNDDLSMRSLTGTTQGTETDIDSSAADVETEHASATYQIYQASDVDKIIAAYIDADGSIQERTATLEVTSASVTLGTEHAVGTATTTAGRQLSTCEYEGDLYVLANVSGTGLTYYIDAGAAGSWDSGTAWKTGLTACTLSQIINVTGIGLGVIYTDNGDVKIDWIDGGPSADVTINGSLATGSGAALTATIKPTIRGSISAATAAAYSALIKPTIRGSLSTATGAALDGTVIVPIIIMGSLSTATAQAYSALIKPTIRGSLSTASAAALIGSVVFDVTGSVATATALARDGTVIAPVTILGSLSTSSALANLGTIVIDIPGSLATGSGAAISGALIAALTGSVAAADGAAYSGALDFTFAGSLATANALALDGDIVVDIVGSTALADAVANDGVVTLGYTVLGSLATASAQANDGTASETGAGDDEPRSGIFQLRPLVAVEA
jgi:hypothetical protein